MAVSELKLKELDRKLQELALTNWQEFTKIIQLDREKLYICIQRSKGKTLRQIANELKVTKKKVEYTCNTSCALLGDKLT